MELTPCRNSWQTWQRRRPGRCTGGVVPRGGRSKSSTGCNSTSRYRSGSRQGRQGRQTIKVMLVVLLAGITTAAAEGEHSADGRHPEVLEIARLLQQVNYTGRFSWIGLFSAGFLRRRAAVLRPRSNAAVKGAGPGVRVLFSPEECRMLAKCNWLPPISIRDTIYPLASLRVEPRGAEGEKIHDCFNPVAVPVDAALQTRGQNVRSLRTR